MRLANDSITRLQRIGIQPWQLRARDAKPDLPRLIVEDGAGDHLLVVDAEQRRHYRVLLEDLVATLGPERCRYACWSEQADAGLALDACAGAGIAHVLVFGRTAIRHPRLIAVPALEDLHQSGRARRLLWQRITVLMGD
ncbi:MAG: DNA polymerase III subunit psi [Wenzhouxiangellaceae bacterium]|nr:DNA polymerase III subunit psi [Wenzhouxiangellaceae bacterium]